MLPMRFFRSRAFSAGNAGVFFLFASLFGAVFFLPQFLQTGLGQTPLASALRLGLWTGTLFLVAPIAGALADRVGERPLLVGGLALQGAGMAWIALIAEPHLPYGEMIAPLVVAGVGASMAIPPAASSVVGAVAREEVGKAAGANSMLRELGGVFGIAILVTVFAGAGSYASARAFSDGFAPAIAISAALSFIGAIAGTGLPGRQPTTDTARQPRPVPALQTQG
jgi:MFS family permease